MLDLFLGYTTLPTPGLLPYMSADVIKWGRDGSCSLHGCLYFKLSLATLESKKLVFESSPWLLFLPLTGG